MKRDKDKGMWTLVMYDLPIKTKEDAGAANRFNHLLADLGFFRVQYSVYARYTPTQSGGRSALTYIKAGLPPPRKRESTMRDRHAMGGFVEIHRQKTAKYTGTTGSTDSFR